MAAPDDYDSTARIILPIEAFGANLRIQNFRKRIRYPDNFDIAIQRAIVSSDELQNKQSLPVIITIGPRTWYPKVPINLRSYNNIDIRGGNAILDFGRHVDYAILGNVDIKLVK